MILIAKLISHDKKALDAAIEEAVEDHMYCIGVYPDDWDAEKEWRIENAQELVSSYIKNEEIKIKISLPYKRIEVIKP